MTGADAVPFRSPDDRLTAEQPGRTDRLSKEDLRELAQIVRGIHARAAAKREREQEGRRS
jgi:hypothetical protein